MSLNGFYEKQMDNDLETFRNVSNFDFSFNIPDITKLKQDRKLRNNSCIKKIEEHAILPDEKTEKLSLQDHAAIKIQKVFRGYIGRKLYNQTLYNAVLNDEESFYKYRDLQVKEGEILIANYKMKHELEDTDDLDRNRFRLMNNNAIVLQRFWRKKHKYKYKQKDHICCPCHEDYPDLYEYYEQTEVICFCCDEHRLTGYVEDEYFSIPTYVNDSGKMTDWFKTALKNGSNLDNNDNFISDLENGIKLASFEDRLLASNNYNMNVIPSHESNSDELEPFKESTRILKSLEIHEESENKIEKSFSNGTNTNNLHEMNLAELHGLVQILEYDISVKNLELVQELMTRDELHTCHEALLMEADDLTNGLK